MPAISLWFFGASDSDPASKTDADAGTDGEDVAGVQIAVPLQSYPVLSALSGIGLRDLQLVYEVRMVDGAAVRGLSAQAIFGLFGADAPPALKDLGLRRLVLSYGRGGGFRVEVAAEFPLGAVTADLDVAAKLTRKPGGGGFE
ncbi:hypothetical protein Franean1_3303 [Parafrankia sp. EAN1pec]|uniref:hypothetical protein n=1 Tax=Parafrankia sp. (strain EAN1pec) TaxID=298653 RepID=UPI0000544593|nr:hypothetical protein Franean1_3303 [Frankia sp. EAN1pec]